MVKLNFRMQENVAHPNISDDWLIEYSIRALSKYLLSKEGPVYLACDRLHVPWQTKVSHCPVSKCD